MLIVIFKKQQGKSSSKKALTPESLQWQRLVHIILLDLARQSDSSFVEPLV